ncbi:MULTISPECIES: hypothetical protein [Stenotrophomonas]|nr:MULTISPECIES: hypothetical protein [Stenotrophomonas]
MNFEKLIAEETAGMSREFAFYGAVIGLVLGVVGTLVVQALLA